MHENSQTLQITVTSTANGFTTEATIYGAGIDFNNQTIGYMWDTAGAHVNHLYTTTASSSDNWDVTTTVLPYRVFGNTGTLRVQYDNNIQRLTMSAALYENNIAFINIYSTSVSLPETVFSSSDWNLIKIGYEVHKSGAGFEDIEINHVNFHSSMSIAIELFESEIGYCSVNPIYLNYNSASAVVLATNAGVGTFYWSAIDGGIVG